MKKLKKLDDLSIEFILASKSLSAFKTVLGVYKHHYGDFSEPVSLDALVEILSAIVQQVSDLRLDKVLGELLPANRWKSGLVGVSEDTPLNEVIVRYLISEMRNLERDKFFEEDAIPSSMSIKDIIGRVLPDMGFLSEGHFYDQAS
jgi:hypothetical protein